MHLTESFIYVELRQLWLCQHRFILELVSSYQYHVSQNFLDESMTNRIDDFKQSRKGLPVK